MFRQKPYQRLETQQIEMKKLYDEYIAQYTISSKPVEILDNDAKSYEPFTVKKVTALTNEKRQEIYGDEFGMTRPPISIRDISEIYTQQEQTYAPIIVDKRLQHELVTDFEIIQCPFDKHNMPHIIRMNIKCNSTAIIFNKNKATFSKPVLVSLICGNLQIWNAYYSENRVMTMDGKSVINGYNVIMFNGDTIKVADKVLLTEFSVDLTELTHINLEGDDTNITFENDIFNDKTLHVSATGFQSTINLGSSEFNDVRTDCINCKVMYVAKGI